MAETEPIKAVYSMVTMSPPNGKEEPILEAYIPLDAEDPYREQVKFTDEEVAQKLGLKDAHIRTPDGVVTASDGLFFVRNMWRMFTGNTYIRCDNPVEGTVHVAPSRPERKASRGEPKMDPMEDIEGQYRRFQQRDQEL